jgi:hypothetical protein
MRYAFQAFDLTYNETYAVKLPKNINEEHYSLQAMSADLESIIICKLIVDEMNDRMINVINSKYLVEFVQAFIYEITDPKAPFKYYYGE